ncbi:MAG: zinc-ribbon domain-containing protein [Candidatus Binatia bacterium]
MIVEVISWVAVAAVAVFVGWPLLRGQYGTAEPAADPTNDLAPLERQKREALTAIKEAEFDHTMGKLSDDDYAALTQRYREQAMAAMTELEKAQPRSGRPRSPAPLAFCPQCAAKLADAANFCSRCGSALRPWAA